MCSTIKMEYYFVYVAQRASTFSLDRAMLDDYSLYVYLSDASVE